MKLIAFLASTDLDRSRSFYVDRLGLQAEELNPYALVLRAGEVMLRVTLVEALAAQPFTVLGWQVDGIDARMAELAGGGIEFVHYDGMGQDDAGVWTTPGGDRVAWFRDPDGNVLSLTQFLDS